MQITAIDSLFTHFTLLKDSYAFSTASVWPRFRLKYGSLGKITAKVNNAWD